MKSILIVGCGEYGRLAGEMAQICGYEKIGYLDDKNQAALDVIDAYPKYKDQYEDFVVAIGNPEARKAFTEKIKDTFNLVSIIHPAAYVSEAATVEPGCIVEPFVVVHRESTVKEGCILNAGAVVNHNTVVESYCQLCCNCVVSAREHVQSGTKISPCVNYSN